MLADEQMSREYIKRYDAMNRLLLVFSIGLFVFALLNILRYIFGFVFDPQVYRIWMTVSILLMLPAGVYAVYLTLMHWRDIVDKEEGRKLLITGLFFSFFVINGFPLVSILLVIYYARRVHVDLRRIKQASIQSPPPAGLGQ